MTLQSEQAHADQARDEAARLAAVSERRNRPAHLLFLSLVLLAVAVGALLLSLGDKGVAERRRTSARASAGEITELLAKINQLDAAAKSGTRQAFGEQVPGLLGKIETAAQEAGLIPHDGPERLPTPSDRQQAGRTPDGQYTRHEVTYAGVRHASLPALLAWAQTCARTIPGLEVKDLALNPEQNQWNMTITFARWERQQ
jgi:hypothetical protein